MKKQIFATALGVALVLGAGSPAFAASSAPTAGQPVSPIADQPDRIIYVDGPAPRPATDAKVIQQRSTSGTEVTVTESESFPVTPEPGETVRIVYWDAVTEISTSLNSESDASADSVSRASCTNSATIDSPTKSSNRAVVYGRGSVSSGCSSSLTLNLYLQEGIVQRASNSFTVPNNGSTYGSSALASVCTYGFDTDYYGIAAWSGGGAVYGPHATIPCRYN